MRIVCSYAPVQNNLQVSSDKVWKRVFEGWYLQIIGLRC